MGARCVAVVVLALAAAVGTGSSATSRLDRYGISVSVPSGWHVRLAFRQHLNGIVLHAATTPLAPDLGDDLASGTQRRLGPNDVLVVLTEYGPARDGSYVGVTNFPRRPQPLAAPRVTGVTFEGQPAPGQSMATFQTAGRYLQLFVFYGRRRPTAAQLAAARRFVSGIRVVPLPLPTRRLLEAAAARLPLAHGRGVPRGFVRLGGLAGVGSLWWRCVGLGARGRVATAFAADRGTATDGVSVRVATTTGDERRAARTVQPGEWAATPPLSAFHGTWRVTQVTEPRTVKARFELDAPPRDANTCFVPVLQVWQRTLPHG